jgi:hypothetical protein
MQDPKDAVEHAPVIYAWHAARLVRQHRLDGVPFIFGEFVAHDSRLLFWDLESQPVRSDQRRTGMPSVALLRLRHRTIFGRYQTNNGQISILAGIGYDAIDPELTFHSQLN